jgi:integrase
MKRPPAPDSRDRVLGDDELALALRAARAMAMPFGPFYQVIFATGQRRDEVAGLSWAELDRAKALWTLPASRTKNGEANLVPLNRHAIAALDEAAAASVAAQAVTELERDAKTRGRKILPAERARVSGEAKAAALAEYPSGARKWPAKGLVLSGTGETPISGYSRAKTRLDADMLALARKDAKAAGDDPEAVELDPWRLHDARRTLATGLQRLGVRFEVTEAVLNHTAGASRSGVAAVYQRHGWGPEKRAALEAWADHCDRAVSPPADTGNVVILERKA